MDDYEYLINFHVYLKESNKSQNLTDHAEIVTRQEMLSEIMELTRDYYEHVNEYDYKQFCKELKNRGIYNLKVLYSKEKPIDVTTIENGEEKGMPH